MPSYVVSAAVGDSQPQVHPLIQQIQQLSQQQQHLNQQQQKIESQFQQQIQLLTRRLEEILKQTATHISTLETRLQSLESGQPDRVVLFELKEKVDGLQEKCEEKNESKTRRKMCLQPSLPVTVPEKTKHYHAPTQCQGAAL